MEEEDLDKKLKQQMQIMRLKKLQKQLESGNEETNEQLEAQIRAEVAEEILNIVKRSINNHIRDTMLPIYEHHELIKAFRAIINQIEKDINQ